ncbi:ABC transporter permease [Rhizobium lusitanum]|uniref:Autoinducer 2 import system permease protein LsrC n=1 Tax=Rhizobium lusitanum TaxID=293958 RepID=A0A7X0ME08_9HYPH|nr:ABC transporter permease [Rhizobium lusitanum]MBB6486996.1 simple sugar transport system permease protein [Rhizobium lusitanum]
MKRFLKVYLDKPELAGLALLIILIVLFQIKSNGVLLSFENIRGIMGLLPEMALVAIGVTILMICGEFDLSVGSVFALMPMSMAVMLNDGIPFSLSLLLGLALCAVIGLINGYVTLQFSIPSFITTLGMLFIARSLTIVISGGFPPLLPDNLPTWLFTDYIWQGAILRMSFLWFALIAIVATAFLSLTNFGNWIRAVGGFNEAAASMGIPVRRVKIVCFMLCSMLAGFAGLLQVLRLGSPLPSIGEGLELQAVAAAVIGGTALAGGIGTVFGAIIGTLLIRTIDNGLVLSRVDANWFKFAIGMLTMFAVIANAWMGKMSRKIKVEAHK